MTSPAATDPLVTLTTDFGASSPYVAAIKGVLLSGCPRARIVDITHAIPPQNVRLGALALEETTPYFPAGTLHVAVVDPGVGTDRALIYAEIGPQRYLAPDNGLLGSLARRTPPARLIRLAEREFWRPEVSATFHGRDILAPVAARLAAGLDPARLGPPHAALVALDDEMVRSGPGRIEGVVRAVDSFGNLITNVEQRHLAAAPIDERLRVRCGPHETFGLFRTYADQPPLTLMALVGSSGYLELAVVNDSAAGMLGLGIGARVRVDWDAADSAD